MTGEMLHDFDAQALADELLDQARTVEFRGHDPFDGLNSTIFQRSGAGRSTAMRIAWLQFHKRSPVNLRSFVGISKKRNPKGIALFILGLLERCADRPDSPERNEAIALGDWLLNESVDRAVWSHFAWGYHFDWAARAFYVPRGKPNAITTCYVARALHGLGHATGEVRFTDAAIDAGLFLDSLYLNEAGIQYYAYIPGETAFVHNASLWSAALVVQTATYRKDDTMKQRALAVARQSVSMQGAGGEWQYGTRSHHRFIDGFHTGYNLEALALIQKTLGTLEFSRSIQKGMDYYRCNFFLTDGTVKYYHDRIWPIDTHSVAQAVITLLKVGGTVADVDLAGRVLHRAEASLYLRDKKRFAYQKGRWFTNRINYLRWTQAWAFYALSVYGRETALRREKRP